jgi:hypothetical protein
MASIVSRRKNGMTPNRAVDSFTNSYGKDLMKPLSVYLRRKGFFMFKVKQVERHNAVTMSIPVVGLERRRGKIIAVCASLSEGFGLWRPG